MEQLEILRQRIHKIHLLQSFEHYFLAKFWRKMQELLAKPRLRGVAAKY